MLLMIDWAFRKGTELRLQHTLKYWMVQAQLLYAYFPYPRAIAHSFTPHIHPSKMGRRTVHRNCSGRS